MSSATAPKAPGGLSRIKWAYVLISIFLTALGICTFIWPEITSAAICSAMGAATIVFGIIKIITYFLREVKGVALNYDFSTGALAVIAGLALLITRDKVVDLLQLVIGVYLVVDSVFKLQAALDAKRLGIPGWWLPLIVTAACLALGVVLIVRESGGLLMLLIGTALVADGLQNLLLAVFSIAAAKALARREKAAGEPAPDPVEAAAAIPDEAIPPETAPAGAPAPETVEIK